MFPSGAVRDAAGIMSMTLVAMEAARNPLRVSNDMIILPGGENGLAVS
jgi:hypothetical protein